MLINIATVLALIVATSALLWGVYLWSKRSPGKHIDSFSTDFLVGLGKGMGLDRYTEREYFGERVQVLSGDFRELHVELEISSGEWRPYMRISVVFPKPLAQDLNVFTDDRTSVSSHVRRMHELEIGDEEFDEEFLLFARDQERLELALPETIRYQMLRIQDDVDELRLTDNSLFLFVDHPCDRAEVKKMLKKAVDLGDRLQRTAEFLGPRSPTAGAGHYEQATFEQTTRSSTSSEIDASDISETGVPRAE